MSDSDEERRPRLRGRRRPLAAGECLSPPAPPPPSPPPPSPPFALDAIGALGDGRVRVHFKAPSRRGAAFADRRRAARRGGQARGRGSTAGAGGQARPPSAPVETWGRRAGARGGRRSGYRRRRRQWRGWPFRASACPRGRRSRLRQAARTASCSMSRVTVWRALVSRPKRLETSSRRPRGGWTGSGSRQRGPIYAESTVGRRPAARPLDLSPRILSCRRAHFGTIGPSHVCLATDSTLLSWAEASLA